MTKKVRTYYNVEFCKHEIYNITDKTGNEFQYEEFDEFNEINININLLTPLNNSIKSNESAVQIQDADMNVGMKPHNKNKSQGISPESIKIISCCLGYNWLLIKWYDNELYYNLTHEIAALQHITFISTVTLSIDNKFKTLYEIMAHKNWLSFKEAINLKMQSHWKQFIYEKIE